MVMSILIYVEGGFYLGLGNIYRMLAIAKAIQSISSIPIRFITTSEDYVCTIIYRENFEVLKVKASQLLASVLNEQFSLLIIDKLNIEESFVKAVKENKQSSIAIFGNNSKANRHADLVINAILDTNQFKNEIFTDYQQGTKYLKGPRYLSLREEFVPQSYEYKKNLQHVLLLFGGTDQANFSYKVLKKLLEANKDLQYTVVVGAGYQNLKMLEEYVVNKPVKLLKDISNVGEIMLTHDFLITSAGTALFEGLYLGLPVIGLFQNDSQKEVFGNFFMTYAYEDIADIYQFMVTTYNNFTEYQQELAVLAVGSGKMEIIENLIGLI